MKMQKEREISGASGSQAALTKAKQLCALNIVGLIFHIIFHRRRPALLLEDTDQRLSTLRRVLQFLRSSILGDGVQAQVALDAEDSEKICKAPAGGSWPVFPTAHKKSINYWSIRYEGFAIVLQRSSAESQS